MTNRRRRGVRASPVKLQQALAVSGLKTQTALAERIADLEGLDNPPRSLVNKVFKGTVVDARSVQRVANALSIEAWLLYASSDEAAVSQSIKPESEDLASISAQLRSGLPLRKLTGPLLIVFAGIASWWIIGLSKDGQSITDKPDFKSDLYSNKERLHATTDAEDLTALVTTDRGADAALNTAAAQLTNSLSDYWHILPALSSTQSDTQQLLDQGIADVVLSLRGQPRGRWLGLSIFAQHADSTKLTWQSILPLSASSDHWQYEMDAAAQAIIQRDSISAASRQAQHKTLTGKHFLDLARTEQNVRRALTEFESALRSDTNYAPAYASLCEALISDSIRSGQQARLVEAAPQCQAALDKSPGRVDAIRVQAVLDRKQGRPVESVEGFEAALARTPDDVDTLIGATEAYLARYQLGHGDEYFKQALVSASRAYDIEPDFWKTGYLLGRVHYFGGDINQAISATQAAAAASLNMNTLSNLGTFQFCAGDFSSAVNSYEKIRQLQPNSHIPEQQLGAMYYHLQNYAAAATGFKRALDMQNASGVAEDFRIWGNYADALRMAESDDAFAAYQKAITLNDRLLAKGDARPSHRIAKAYYQEMLYLLDPTGPRITSDELSGLTKQASTADPRFVLLLVVVLAQHDQKRLAETLMRQAASGCPGMMASPDLIRSGLEVIN